MKLLKRWQVLTGSNLNRDFRTLEGEDETFSVIWFTYNRELGNIH